nr:hypothetical protein [Rhizobium sp. ACO-34A]
MMAKPLISCFAIALVGLGLGGCVSDPYYHDYRYSGRYYGDRYYGEPRRPTVVYRADRREAWDRRHPPRVYRDGRRYQPQPWPVYR